MKRGIVLSVLGIGLAASSANAGSLSMRFAGGGIERTLGPGESATIEVLFAHGALDGKAAKVTGVDARFDVGSLATNGTFGDYVVDGSTKLNVTSAAAGAFTNWNTAATTAMPAVFNGSFFLSAGDPEGVNGPIGISAPTGGVVVASFTVQKTALGTGDTYIVFRNLDPLPTVYNGTNAWANRFGSATITGAQQFETANGNQGDAGPGNTYHGFETLTPLIIHQVPEPSALALLALGGFAMIRRRK